MCKTSVPLVRSGWLFTALLLACSAPGSDPEDSTSPGGDSAGTNASAGDSGAGASGGMPRAGAGGSATAGGGGGKSDGGTGKGGSTGTGGTGGKLIPGNPNGSWTNATGNLAGTPSDCGTIPYVTTKPGENLLIVGVVKRGVFASTDSGTSFTELGTGAGSADFTAGLSDVLFDPNDGAKWWLAGVRYGSPFRTDDNGQTFEKLGDFPQNDGIAVDISDPDRKTILVGGHEQVQEVEYSDDGGSTWTNIGVNLPSDSGHSSYPYVVNASTFLVGTANNQVYRTTDKGAHFTKVVDGGGGAKPLKHSNGSLYWAARETRGLVRSTDDGVTWNVVTPGGIVYGMRPIELPDGRIAMRSPKGMLVAADEGASWRQISPSVPNDYWWFVSTYSPQDKAFYTNRFACDGSTVVNADALMRFAWDYTKD